MCNKLQCDFDVDPLQRERMHRWLAAATKKRRKEWQGWLTKQWGRSGGMLPRWAQREGAERGYTGLKLELAGEVQTISSRPEAAANTWGSMWAGGATYTRQDSDPLEPIDGPMVRQALRRQGRKG